MKQKRFIRDTREMTTDSQRFRFVLRFVGLDLDRFRAGDWQNLQEDLRNFLLPIYADLKPGGLHTWPDVGPMPEEYSQADFQALQAETQDYLVRVITSRANPEAWAPQWIRIGLTNPHISAQDGGYPGRHVLSVHGAVRDLFLFRVGALLQRVNTGALTRCPDCDTIFLRKSNQTYCSRRCVNRVGQRRWREQQDATTLPSTDQPLVAARTP
jgi:hypothetical protein